MEHDEEREFYRRRNLPGVDIRRTFAGRKGNVCDTFLTYCGQDIGSRHSRGTGKRERVSYRLPEMRDPRLLRFS